MNAAMVGIGEVLWDLLPAGKQLGGAPANFAYHARALGADGRIISRVGADALGVELRDRLRVLGVPTEAIQIDPQAPTGTVSVSLDDAGVPEYRIHENVAWDALEATREALALVRDAQAICFGTLAQRTEQSRNAIRTLVSASPSQAFRIFDINLRQHYYSAEIIEGSLELANVFKVNDQELPIVAKLFALTGGVKEQIEALSQRFELRAVACTRGGQGSLLFLDGTWSDHPGIPTRVADTVGAGDSFTAAMGIGLLYGWSADTINERANRVAAWVAGSVGATPDLPGEIKALFR